MVNCLFIQIFGRDDNLEEKNWRLVEKHLKTSSYNQKVNTTKDKRDWIRILTMC